MNDIHIDYCHDKVSDYNYATAMVDSVEIVYSNLKYILCVCVCLFVYEKT